jgi:hypothetical protein
MTCPDWEAQLNEYVDGALAAAERAALEHHLAGCAGCRAAVAELRALVAGARALPKVVKPERELWAGIETRIVRRATGSVQRSWWRERAFWRGAAAAAAVLLTAFGLYRLTARPPDGPVGGGGGESAGWVAIEADYERATEELTRALEAQRGWLRPETVEVIERNLRIIDAAIRESGAALVGNPNSAELRQLFSAAYRQKVELLRWATRVATPAS